jgi:hypothetical protein
VTGAKVPAAARGTGTFVSAEPGHTVSGRPAPRLSLAEAEVQLEATGRPFLCFVNTRTGRGNLIYHRYDGHYGLTEPAESRA